MESSAALPHAARELLLKGGGCAVNFECAPELCAPFWRGAGPKRAQRWLRACGRRLYDRMDTAAYLRLFERMAGTRGMADAALAAMGLEDARRTPLRRLTPAQRRRLSIAREIVRAPGGVFTSKNRWPGRTRKDAGVFWNGWTACRPQAGAASRPRLPRARSICCRASATI